jgi:transposase InsO family protein
MKQQGDCYDNAMMESLWATLKKELVQHAKLKTRAQARSSIFEWIEVWYQRERSHSSLGYLGPEAFEAARRVGSYECVSTESGEVQSGPPQIWWTPQTRGHFAK